MSSSLKQQMEMLTNFLVPIYETLNINLNDVVQAKHDTVAIMMDNVGKYIMNNDRVELYTLGPVLDLIEHVLSVRIAEIGAVNKNTPKEVVELKEFYSSLLLMINKFNKICRKTKKE